MNSGKPSDSKQSKEMDPTSVDHLGGLSFGGRSIICEEEEKSKQGGRLLHFNFYNGFVDDFDMSDVQEK